MQHYEICGKYMRIDVQLIILCGNTIIRRKNHKIHKTAWKSMILVFCIIVPLRPWDLRALGTMGPMGQHMSRTKTKTKPKQKTKKRTKQQNRHKTNTHAKQNINTTSTSTTHIKQHKTKTQQKQTHRLV